MSDISWKKTVKPVLQFLRGDLRSWPDLLLWHKNVGMGGTRLRHSLAWLENKGLAQVVIKPVKNSKGAFRDKVFWTASKSPDLTTKHGPADQGDNTPKDKKGRRILNESDKGDYDPADQDHQSS